MVPRDSRRERRSGRPRRRPERLAVEGLETRQLMAYSPFGYSLPELSVTGYAARTASWGGTLSVAITVENQGASSLIEPLDLATGSLNNTLNVPATTPTNSTADAPATTAEVFASAKPNATKGLILLGSVAIPSVTQNSSFTADDSITLPSRPKGFPGNNGKIYLTLVVNNDQTILQTTNTQNIYRVPNGVKITAPLPDLQVVGFDVPSSLQPGDVIAPTIEIANFGAANPAAQGPVTVELVASLDKNFGPGDAVLGSFVITSLPGVSAVPSQTTIATGANVIPTANEITTTLSPLKLPTTPGTYFIGIEIDPTGSIKQTYAPTPALMAVTQVGPADPLLASTTLLVNTDGMVPVFPALPSSVIGPPATTTTTTTTTTGTGTFLLTPTGVLLPDNPVLEVSAASVKAGKTTPKKHPKP